MHTHISGMNRRAFNASLLSGAAVATLPIPAAGAVASKTAQNGLYAWAVAIARAQNRASPAMLARQLGISHAAAAELYGAMIANGAVKAPLLGGMARAADPLFKGGQLKVVDAKISQSASARFKDMKRAFDKLAEVPDEVEPDQAT